MPPRERPVVARRQVADAQVLDHAQRWQETELLMDERQPVLSVFTRREGKGRSLAENRQRCARLGRMIARKDPDQRRFAGAVLPQKAMDLPGQNRKADVVERLGAAERL